jgi:formate/nitrite transporter FocA (FNT family)
VTTFILCGTEHSVADMYYWAVSGVLVQAPAQSLLRIGVITLGNVAGGLFLPLGEKLYRRLEG